MNKSLFHTGEYNRELAYHLKVKYSDQLSGIPIEEISRSISEFKPYKNQSRSSVLIRLTLLPAMVVVALLILVSPITFAFTGKFIIESKFMERWIDSIFFLD